MTKPVPSAGDLALILGGEEVTLKCTPAAALALCRSPGGLYGVGGTPGVSDRVLNCDIDTMAFVIRTGLGLTGKAVPALEEWIFHYGLIDLRQELSVYIGSVANGGKPIGVPTENANPDAPDGDAGAGEGKPDEAAGA